MAAVHPFTPTPSRGLGPHTKHSRKNPCPICGNGTSYCLTFLDGATLCGKMPSDHPAGLGYMHWPNGRPADWREQLAALPKPEPRPTVDGALVDRANRALLTHCPLSDDDRAGLHARGFTDAEIAGNFGTLPDNPQERARIVAAVTEALGQDPAGVVPGFVSKNGRTELVKLPGLLVAGWTDDGLLGSCQVRVKNPGDGGKYRHLSAGDGPGSIGADGHFVNVSRPSRPVSTRVVLFTEGYIKGLILAHRLGRIALSVAGVSNTAKVVATLQRIGDVEQVWTAYDRDSATNPHVAAAEARIVRELAAAGYTVKQLDWPDEYGKGLDDALQNGVIPVVIDHPALARAAAPAPSAPTINDEHRQAVAMNKARARIQRNTKLPARPMAAAVLGVFAQAATASDPTGGFRVPAGFALAPVGTLAFDAGTKTSNAGTQLKKLEEAGLISRHTVPDTLPPGRANPETGEVLSTPRRIERHFIAVKGHEHEPITPAVWSALVERMATYDSATPERRGGLRIPRCPEHPHAKVARHWTARCGECDRQLYPAPGEEAVDEIPAMLLVPTVDQTLVDRPEPADHDDATSFFGEPLGLRPIAHKVQGTVTDATVDQTLVHRETHAAAPEWDELSEDERRALAHISVGQWRDRHAANADPDPPPPLTLFPLSEAGCLGCGAYVAAGQSHCRGCDPRTA